MLGCPVGRTSSLLQRGSDLQEVVALSNRAEAPPVSEHVSAEAQSSPPQTVGSGHAQSAAHVIFHESSAGARRLDARGSITISKGQSLYALWGVVSLIVAGIILIGWCIWRQSTARAQGKSANRHFTQDHALLTHDPEGKVYAYDNNKLLNWNVIFIRTGSVFCHRRVVLVTLQVIGLSLATALLQICFVPHLKKFDPSRFQSFFKLVRVFIAFLLGLFLNNSFARWWQSVGCFKKLLISIKQLLYTLHTIGIREDARKKVERLCVAACYIINEDMHTASASITHTEKNRWHEKLVWLEKKGFLVSEERLELEGEHPQVGKVGLHSQLLWAWIGDIITRIKSEPQLSAPLYVKLVFLCHGCIALFDDMKTNLMVQVPFAYSHLLASLVHITNISLAVMFGLEVGCMVTELREQSANEATWSTEGAEAAAMKFFILVAQPMLYQSVLVICEANLQPYGDELCHMPTDTFIQQMLGELVVMEDGFANARQRAIEEAEATGSDLPWHLKFTKHDYERSQKSSSEEDDDFDCD